jgi:hypothetical protein
VTAPTVLHCADGELTRELRRLLFISHIPIRARCGVVRPVILPYPPELGRDGVLCRNCARIRARGGDEV